MNDRLGVRARVQSGRRLMKNGGRVSFALAALLLLLQACGGRALDDGGKRGGSGDGDGDGDQAEIGSGGAPNPMGSGGAEPSTGGSVLATGGSLVATGGALTATGGSPEATGGDGTGGQAPLPLPEGCEPHMPTADNDSCSLSVVCGESSDHVSCTLLDSGNWQCGCQPFHDDRLYELDGAAGIDACAVASHLCVDDLDLGEEACGRHSINNANWCAAELACRRPIGIDLPAGVDAWLVDYTSTQCEGADTQFALDCFCLRDGTTSSYYALAQADAEVCGPLADFCKAGDEVVFEGEPSCVETSNEYSTGSCMQVETCTHAADLTDDVQLTESTIFSASCEVLDSTTSRCRCWDDSAHNSFLVESDAEPAACTTAFLNCAEDATIEVQGDAECTLASLNAEADYCAAELNCLQPVTVDGREMVAEGSMGYMCLRRATDQSWWCSCASSEGTITFELGAESASTAEVCDAAPAACIEQLPSFIGSSSSIPELPHPLPPAQ